MSGENNFLFWLNTHWWSCRRLHNTSWCALIFIHGGSFTILSLPCMIDLQTTMKLMTTCLFQNLSEKNSIIYKSPNLMCDPLNFTSSNSMSQEVLIASRSSLYFHFDKSCFCRPFICCCARTFSDLDFFLNEKYRNHWKKCALLFFHFGKIK